MNRRSASCVGRVLLIVTLVVAAAIGTGPATSWAAGVDDNAATVDTTPPVDTANPFLPDEQDLTDCVGLVERPGCGSEARGGLHQNLVAIAVVGGLLLVFGRVAWGVRRSQQRASDPRP